MRRRALLASLSTVVALPGCGRPSQQTSTTPNDTTATGTGKTTSTTTTDTQSTTETTTPTETTTTTTPDPDYPRFVEISSVDGTDYPGLSFTVSVESGRIDAEQTATLSSSLKNTGETTIDLEMGYNPPFSAVRCDGGGYLLVKPDTAGELDACWEQDHHPGQPALLTKPTLKPGERISNEMRALGDTSTDACLPTGVFRFVSSFDVVKNGDREGRANAFTLRVTRN